MTTATATITHHGEMFYPTGKVGRTADTGERSREYESDETPGRRVWVTDSGRVIEE